MLVYQFSPPHSYIFSLKRWENVLYELGSERVMVDCGCWLDMCCLSGWDDGDGDNDDDMGQCCDDDGDDGDGYNNIVIMAVVSTMMTVMLI